MTNSVVAEILEDFVSLFFPRCCLACHDSLVKGEDVICTNCMLEMPMTNYHRDFENPLKTRLTGRIELKYAMALFRFSKSGRVQELLHALKYKNHPEIGLMLGKVYAEKMKESGLSQEFDVVIPVPLHPARKRKRGYNQSAKFAEGISEKLSIPFSEELVQRTVKTETQTRKTKLSRWQNVKEVFQVNDPTLVRKKRILLVDDVITTGATLEACAQSLINQDCAALSIACIAEA